MPEAAALPVAQALDAERAILGAMIVSSQAADIGLRSLTPNAFHYDANGKAFAALGAIRERGDPPSLVMLITELTLRGEIEAAGGAFALSGLLDVATEPVNIEPLARLVRAAHADRERVKVGLQMANGATGDAEATRATLAHLEAIQRAVDGTESDAKRWAGLSMTGRQLIDASIPPLASWLGDGLLPEGELCFLNGQSGVGKTFLIVQLMSALSIGHTFNGIATRACRVGLVEMEMPWASIQSRIAALSKGDFDRMAFLCSPPGALHLDKAESQQKLAEFCRLHALDVLILDPFNRLHDGDENSASDMGKVLQGLHDLRQPDNVSIIALHHVRKQPSGLPAGPHTRSASLDSGRGHSRLHNDPALVLSLDEAKGFVRLTFAKVRHAREPLPIYLKRNDRGFFDVADDPALAKERRRDSLTQMLDKAAGDGITAELAAEVLSVNVRTIRRDLKDLGATMTIRGKNDRVWSRAEDGELGL